jgi:orotidine-5'-phosphate decarboxylase
MTQNNSPIIVALDFDNKIEAVNLVKQLDPKLCRLKIGKQLFSACGPQIVTEVMNYGFDVFLDLKFHDIANTVYNAVKVVAKLGVWMTNVHAQGGEKMLVAAKNAIIHVNSQTLIVAVTILTSLEQKDLLIYHPDIDINKTIEKLAKLSYNCGLDGVVCSAHEANKIKSITTPDFITVCPGIRPINANLDDQNRVMTPNLARQNKADYLVIGRPITNATNPNQALLNILMTLETQ